VVESRVWWLQHSKVRTPTTHSVCPGALVRDWVLLTGHGSFSVIRRCEERDSPYIRQLDKSIGLEGETMSNAASHGIAFVVDT